MFTRPVDKNKMVEVPSSQAVYDTNIACLLDYIKAHQSHDPPIFETGLKHRSFR